MKECSWALKNLKKSLNRQETGKFEEIKAVTGRHKKSSPILGNPSNSFFDPQQAISKQPNWAGT